MIEWTWNTKYSMVSDCKKYHVAMALQRGEPVYSAVWDQRHRGFFGTLIEAQQLCEGDKKK